MASLPSRTAVKATGWRHVFGLESAAAQENWRNGLCVRPFPGDHPERSGNMADSRRSGQHTARTRRSQRGHGWVCFRYLVYLNNGVFGERVLKTMHLFDQKTAP